MAGHIGAGAIAGYLFSHMLPGLPQQVHSAIEQEIDRIFAGEKDVWVRNTGVEVRELL